MKIVFFGTPDYVLPVLEMLNKYYEIVAVVTQPPKPTGRDQKMTYSPVDDFAHKRKIPVYFDAEELINDQIEADLGVLESYGKILSKSVLNYFPNGIINIHPSLLPRWRGAVPVPATLISGDKETGGTIIKLDSEIDHGPILASFKEDILENDTTETLRRRIFEKSAVVLEELIPPYIKQKVKLKPQDHSLATYTTRAKKEDAYIKPEYIDGALNGFSINENWTINFIKDFFLIPDPYTIDRFIRSMNPWPNAWTTIKVSGGSSVTKRLKLIMSHIEDEKLILDTVQLEGKNPVSWKQFKEAYSSYELI